MPTLIPVYIPYKDGTSSVEVVTARHADTDIESCLSLLQGRDTVGGSGDSRNADADIESCLSPVKGRDTVGGSGDRHACRCRH
jgi:hypothetical protein